MLPRDQKNDESLVAMLRSELTSARSKGDVIGHLWSCLSVQVSIDLLTLIEWDRSLNAPRRIQTFARSFETVEQQNFDSESVWERYIPVFRFIWNWDELNPIRRRSYLHDPIYHQVTYRFAATSSSDLILSLSRTCSRFSDRALKLLRTTGDIIAPVVLEIHAKEDALKKSKLIASLLESRYGLRRTDCLSFGELELLTDLTTGMKIRAIAHLKNVRRDTVSRKLSAAREKLGASSNKELIGALRPL